MSVDKNDLEEEYSILRFYKTVLSWDYIRLLESNNKQNLGENISDGLKDVKNTYVDVDEYLNTFEPLLFEEVKAQIVLGRDVEDEETKWGHVIIQDCSEVNGFHFLTVFCPDVSLSNKDLLLLSTKQFGEGKQSPITYAFAVVEHRQHDIVQLRLYLSGEVTKCNTDDVQPCPRLCNMIPVVSTVKTYLHLLKICSLSTTLREYVAMQSIRSLPFKDVILNAADAVNYTEDHAWKLSTPHTEYIESSHNKSQLEAIHAGLSRKPFVLIQGPPGTGKTQTILGLLSAILHASPARVPSNKEKLIGVKRGPELAAHERCNHWKKASPCLCGINPQDQIMPKNGDDGFYPASGNDLKSEVLNSSRKYRVRILVCTPSYPALDVIVARLLNTGICDENGHAYIPKIVRVGHIVHHTVQAVSMDNLVAQKLSDIDCQVGDKRRKGGAGKDKDSVRASIMDDAVIVFSTLSHSGSSHFSKLNCAFDVVIIDEAAQAVEPATLIPLASGCKQVFLIGDPVQLQATVISSVAKKFGYQMSLFKRFQRAGYPVHMLKTQYRMNPEIRSFPSREFYDGELEDGPGVKDQTKRAWHKFRPFGPFCFFDIHEGKEESKPLGYGSWLNVDEADFVLSIYRVLVSRYPELKKSFRLAIISPYRYQVELLREKFRSTFGIDSDEVVDINTVDGFQGREMDVAIFSCVRASKYKGIGFLADFRRMNFGITRARSSVLVVGSASTLRRGDGHWKNLIESAEKRDVLFKVSKPYSEFFSEENLKSMEVKETKEEVSEEMDVGVPTFTETANNGDEDVGTD